MTQIRLFIIIGLLTSALAAGAYVWWLQGRLSDAEGEATRLRTALAVSEFQRDWEKSQRLRSVAALEAERMAADIRADAVTEGREAVITASESDDAPTAVVLERAMRAADRIGGLK